MSSLVRRLPLVLIFLGGLAGSSHAKPRLETEKVVVRQQADSAALSAARLRLNQTTGLYEQRVRVTNDHGAKIDGFELKVTKTGNKVRLLTGTRAPGGGIYSSSHSLAAGESVTVILRYQIKRRGSLRKPKVSCAFILPSLELPPVQGEVVIGGTEDLTVSGGTGCQVISVGSGDQLIFAEAVSLDIVRLIPDGTGWIGLADSDGALEPSGDLVGDFSTTSSGVASRWLDNNRDSAVSDGSTSEMVGQADFAETVLETELGPQEELSPSGGQSR